MRPTVTEQNTDHHFPHILRVVKLNLGETKIQQGTTHTIRLESS